ncbi:MAG: class I SAM-dependent methyltransferase [Terriglobia bacterium]
MDSFLNRVLRLTTAPLLRVLDLGCGTGFASSTVLQRGAGRIGELVCADISPHMLAVCRSKLGSTPGVRFHLGGVESLGGEFGEFDLIITCSVLHHISDVPSFLRGLVQLMPSGGFYMMLHEPSARFYRNQACYEFYTRYRNSERSRRVLQILNPNAYVGKVRRLLAGKRRFNIEAETIRLLLQRQVIHSPLSLREVRQLVDIHVPPIHDGSFILGREGFDLGDLRSTYLSGLSLVEDCSYGFLGTVYEGSAPWHWRRRARRLSLRYPSDGAQFGALWRRPADSRQVSHVL